MIWLRRALTVPLGILLLLTLLLALVVLQVNATFLTPGYYTEELRKADIYEFMLQDVMTSALDEARALDIEQLPEELEGNPLVTLGLSTEEVVASINRAVPPEWIQSIVEQIFEGLGGYITSESDEFDVTVEAGDQAVILVSEIKSLLRSANAYDFLFEEVIIPRINEALSVELPLGITISDEQLIESVNAIVPPDWVQAQVETALDEITPYAVGERDNFTVNIRLDDRVSIALEEVKVILRNADAYDLLYDQVIDPGIAGALGDGVPLPFGLYVTTDEILVAMRQVAGADWVQTQAERVIDQASPYMSGQVDTFAVNVSLVNNKREAHDVVVDIIQRKLTEQVDALAPCGLDEALRELVNGSFQQLPRCLPGDFDSRRLIEYYQPVVSRAVNSLVLDIVPDQVFFTDADLRDGLVLAGAEENLALLDDVRAIIKDGLTYSDVDLREDIIEFADADALDAFDDARAFLTDGWRYDEVKFRDNIVDAGDIDALNTFDYLRDSFKTVRTLRWLVYLPVIVLLLIIGLLGGRTWSSKIAWAAASLSIIAAIIWLASSPLYNLFGDPRLEDLRVDTIESTELNENFPETELLIIDKALDMLESVIDGFASGIAFRSVIILAIGLIALGASLSWKHINWDGPKRGMNELRARLPSVAFSNLRRPRLGRG